MTPYMKILNGVNLGSEADSNVFSIILYNCSAASGFEYADE